MCGCVRACVGPTRVFHVNGHIDCPSLHRLKAPLHDTIRPHGPCRLPCTWVNRNVWHVARMSRTRENRVKRNYSSFYVRADSAARAVRVHNQSAADYKTTFTLYAYERETGSELKITRQNATYDSLE